MPLRHCTTKEPVLRPALLTFICSRYLHLLSDGLSQLPLRQSKIIIYLQVHPKPTTGPEIPAKTEGRFQGYRAMTPHDVGQAITRHAQFER